MSDSTEGHGLYTHDEYEEFDLGGENSDEEDQETPAPEGFFGGGEGNSGGKEQVRWDIIVRSPRNNDTLRAPVCSF